MRKRYFFFRNMSALLMCILTAASGILGLLFSGGSRADSIFYIPWTFFGDAFIPLIIFSFALWFRNRFCAIVAIVLSFLNIFLRTTSIVLYQKTFMPLDFFSIQLLLEHADAAGTQAVLGSNFIFWLVPLLAAISCGIAYLCVVIWRSSGRKRKQLASAWHISFAVLLALSALSNVFYAVSSRIINPHFYTGHLVQPLPFGVVDMANDSLNYFFPDKHKTHTFSPESQQLLMQFGMLPPAGELSATPVDKPFDKIIIIAVESLDYKYIHAVNPEIPAGVTPVLDKLTAEYPAMTNYFAAAQPTSWGLSALLLSRPDYRWEKNYRLNESVFTVAQKNGFKTYYFSAVSGSFGNNRETYRSIFKPEKIFFLEEWQKYYAKEQSPSSVWGLADHELYDGVMQVLQQERAERFIAVISTIDTHPPYNAPMLTPQEKQQFSGDFLQSLYSTDKSLGQFLNKIRSNKALYNENTLIIITADHSATHGENYLKRESYDPDRIPLIFVTPRKEVFNKINLNKYASSIDLPPTLLQLIKCNIPESFMGRTLFSEKSTAFCWTIPQVLNVHTAADWWSIEIKNPPVQPLRRAFYDFFRMYYPN
ncbi:MAG: hypothetical protein E7041_03510 [Lentisphaerae bacterium]|nr:hypothetical protein [Lentisphaerota bacterium]